MNKSQEIEGLNVVINDNPYESVPKEYRPKHPDDVWEEIEKERAYVKKYKRENVTTKP